MTEEEERIKEYEERLQLESLKRKVSKMKFPAPDSKKPKMTFSKSLSSLMAANQLKPEPAPISMAIKMKSSVKAIKLAVNMSQASKARIVDKPWKFTGAVSAVDECTICSNELFSVCHPHISSLEEKIKDEEDKEENEKQVRGKRRLVLCSSTLHNIWKEATYRPGFHIDFDCIIGGQIHDSHASFLQQYGEEEQPLDVLLATGINNVGNLEESAPEIIFQIRSLIKTIQDKNRDSRVVVATMLFAPKYCDVGVPPSRNMVEKVGVKANIFQL